jgi:uncharacterized protein (TIGR02266 family)
LVDPNTRQGKRTPVTLKIKFKSETLEQFIERYAVDVSQGGIFIRTKEPLAVGTQMKFEFQLRDASPLIAGEGTVVWTRENDPSRPAIELRLMTEPPPAAFSSDDHRATSLSTSLCSACCSDFDPVFLATAYCR